MLAVVAWELCECVLLKLHLPCFSLLPLLPEKTGLNKEQQNQPVHSHTPPAQENE